MKNETLILSRTFNAPRDKVWKAWTDAKEFKKWWGPEGFKAPTIDIDLKVGGKYLWCMRGSQAPGKPEENFWTTGSFKEIVPMKKLVYTDSFADEKGNPVQPAYYGMSDMADRQEVTVELEEEGEKTRMTLTHKGLLTDKMKDDCAMGWNSSFNKMDKIIK